MAGTKRRTRKRRKTIIDLMLEKKGIRVAHIARTLSVSVMAVFNTLDRIRHNLKIQEHIAMLLESDPFELWSVDYQPFHKMHHETVYPAAYIPKGNILKSPIQVKLHEQGIRLRHIAQATSTSISLVCSVLRNNAHNKRVQDYIATRLNTTPEELFGKNSKLFRSKTDEYRTDGHEPDLVRNAALKAALRARGITQSRIAESLNLSRQMISMVMRGELRHERIQNKIAEILGKDPARLWGTTYAPFCKKQLQAIRNHQPLSMIG